LTKPLIIIPTYNEIDNIEHIITAVLGTDDRFEILVVDDTSPDGTGDYVADREQEEPRLHLLSRTDKAGLGRAYIAGFQWALERDFNYIFEMDADFSHSPNDLPRLLSACTEGDYQLAVGSRYVKGGRVVNWGLYRQALSYGASLYVRTLTGMNVKDPTAGFICYHRDVLSTIKLDEIRFSGYAFQIEMKFRAYRSGFKIAEVPITFKDRELGESKLDTSIIKEAAWGVWTLRNTVKPFIVLFQMIFWRLWPMAKMTQRHFI